MISDQLLDEHRHELHQVLAFAALYDMSRITSMLVYPTLPGTWQRSAERECTTTVAYLNRHGLDPSLGP